MRASYIVYVITLVFTVLAFFLQVAPSVESAYIEKTLGMTAVEVADVSAIYLIIYGLMQVPNGYFLDRFGMRMLPLFVLVALFGASLFWIFETEFSLAIGRFFVGLGCSIAFTSAVYMASKVSSPQRRPFFIALVSVSASVGAIFATRVLKLSLDSFGWDAVQVTIIIAVLSLVVLSVIFATKACRGEKQVVTKESMNLFGEVKSVFKQKKLVAIFVYTFFTWFIMMSFAGYWARDYLMAVHQYTEERALSVMQLYWVTYLLSSLSITYFIKGVGRCIKVIKFMALVSAVTFLIMGTPFVYDYFWIEVIALFAGISTAGVSIGFSIVSLTVSKKMVGVAVALNNTFLVLGGFLGQLLFGVAVNAFSKTQLTGFEGMLTNYYYALLLLPISSVIAFVALFIGFRKSSG